MHGMEAVDIQYAFATLFETPLGQRGLSHDAEVFSDGNVKDFAKLVNDLSKGLTKRMDRIRFLPEESYQSEAKIRIDAAIERLERISNKITENEPWDFHWKIIGNLVWIVGSLLDHIEGRGPL